MKSAPSRHALLSETALSLPVSGLDPRKRDILKPGQDIGALDAFLRSDRAPPHCMLLSELDGFLTGIAIGPELIRPSEWLPRVWGDEEAVFEDTDEARTVISGIMLRFDEILHDVDLGTFAPILWQMPDGSTESEDWCDGFARAIGLRINAWRPMIDDRRYAIYLAPIMGLSSSPEGQMALGQGAVGRDELRKAPGEILYASVMGMAAFWRKTRRDPLLNAAAFAAKAGRNGPCPCGSGRKFKKCCGRL